MGEPGHRVCKDIVQGGDVVHLDEVVVALDVRNPGLNVDGLGEDHRRREEEAPGEEPLYRQCEAGGTGGKGNQGNRGVFSSEASETRLVPVTRRQRSASEHRNCALKSLQSPLCCKSNQSTYCNHTHFTPTYTWKTKLALKTSNMAG